MSRWLIRIVIFLVGSAALLVIGLAALLVRGPIDLDFLRPTMERALSSPEGAFRVAEARAREQLSLPMYAELERAQVEEVAAAVADFAAVAA